MADIIQLLPDSVANQIAAGEVIQRPASVVKELLENAIDAGGNEIKVIIREAGRTLIQIIDNGIGMSDTDARLSFERHATSKIRKAGDLFSIRTMGFRGEALASISAIAQVELKTRLHDQDLGTRIVIHGSEVISQEVCQTPGGTSIAVKNLFYNVPARRKFLKSNAVEMRHILEEFQRIAISHPDIFLSLYHDANEIFHLPKANRRQRIVSVFGTGANKKLVPIGEDTDVVKINGFVGKIEFAKKTRGEQYLYVNNRFIKSPYLNHAIMGAYEDLLPKGHFPLYVIFLEMDPAIIDVNIHPTKQEIKFEDERLMYNYIKVAVRHALGRHNITPTLDFEQEIGFAGSHQSPSPQYDKSGGSGGYKPLNPPDAGQWETVLEGIRDVNFSEKEESITIESELSDGDNLVQADRKTPYQIHSIYIISQLKSGFLLIDQQAASERILYEKYLQELEKQQPSTQQLLFPQTIQTSTADGAILRELMGTINQIGFDLQEFGSDTFILHGIPSDLKPETNPENLIEGLIEQFKEEVDISSNAAHKVSLSLARSQSIKRGEKLEGSSMQEMIDQLFACEMPYMSPTGWNCFITFELDDLLKRFQKKQ